MRTCSTRSADNWFVRVSSGHTGFLSKDVLKQHLAPPSLNDKVKVFVCGASCPPPLCLRVRPPPLTALSSTTQYRPARPGRRDRGEEGGPEAGRGRWDPQGARVHRGPGVQVLSVRSASRDRLRDADGARVGFVAGRVVVSRFDAVVDGSDGADRLTDVGLWLYRHILILYRCRRLDGRGQQSMQRPTVHAEPSPSND